MNERNIIFLSELEHINAHERFLDARPDVLEEGYILIPLDAEIENALTEKGVAFQSGKEYRTRNTERLVLAEEWTSDVFENERWAFFAYRGVSIGHLYFQQLQGYIGLILYYSDIVSNVLAKHPQIRRLIVFPSSVARPAVERCLTGPVINVLEDVVANIARQKWIGVLIPKESSLANARSRMALFAFKRTVFGLGIGIFNIFIALARRPRCIRILASDYWHNLAPTLQYLNSAEVFLIDRKEAFSAGMANIWKFRMRFVHLDAFSPKISDERKQAQKLFTQEWQDIRVSDLSVFLFQGFSIQSLLIKAIDCIVEEAVGKTLKDIDDAHALLARLRPDVVLLRATISAQTHFAILANVARTHGVPSIEIQHGLLYFGPGSMTKRHSVEYMGVYGPLTQMEMKKAGDYQSTPVVIGSPRFDVYARQGKDRNIEDTARGKNITFLYIAPFIFPELSTDSYDVVDYFDAIASAMRNIPNARVILKLRPGFNRDPFFRATIASLFDGIQYTIAQREPLTDLFKQADIVISGYSTAALEALQCGKPMVYIGLCPLDNMTGSYHFMPYVEAGAMRFASSREELSNILGELASNPDARKSLSEKATAFLAREYAFDGKASERAAEFIESLTQKK